MTIAMWLAEASRHESINPTGQPIHERTHTKSSIDRHPIRVRTLVREAVGWAHWIFFWILDLLRTVTDKN